MEENMIIASPKVYLVGSTKFDKPLLIQYLQETGNQDFIKDVEESGVDEMDICSFYAKLCYKSLTIGHNNNISKTRSIAKNFINCIESGHGSVMEHATLNFVAENVSRIETTEHIRHRAGQAISAESGRYCTANDLIVWVPFYIQMRGEEYVNDFLEYMEAIEINYMKFRDKLLAGISSFDEKKKATSASRRLKPMGCGETLGFTLNLRSIRHTVVMRTSRHAEEEIRIVFNQVANIVKDKIPLLFNDMEAVEVNGLLEYSHIG